MRRRRARESDEIVVARIWRESAGYLQVGVDRGQAVQESDIGSDFSGRHVGPKFGPQEDSFKFREQEGTSHQFKSALQPRPQ